MVPVIPKPQTEISSQAGLPPFRRLLPQALIINAAAIGVLLLVGQVWLALGAFAGALVGVALFWSLHLISRTLVDEFMDAEAERKALKNFGPKPQAETRRAALWRLAGMLGLKYLGLAAVMMVMYHFIQSHLIPFFLAFLGAFALTQISIVSAATRAMRTLK